MEKENKQGNAVIRPGRLSTDTSLVNQPTGTTRFVLNGANRTQKGDIGFIPLDNSNESCYELPSGFIPLGETYIGNEQTALLLADALGNSIIAVTNKDCSLSIVFDDRLQSEKMGFKVSQQIDVSFRLRRGCERTLYWVDPKPRIFVIDKPREFQDEVTGEWVISKFNLFKTYNSIPNFDDVEVLNSGGNLLPGGYNFSIQYLDADLNPTEFITSTETVEIYNSNLNLPFRDIRGSTSKKEEYQDFGNTDKAIQITLSNLDTTFPFYRIAITESNNGSGQISDTKYTAEISTRNTIFTYTGDNYQTIGTQNEILIFNTIIESATSIEQIENRLILGDVKGKQLNYCNLQKYASKVTADMITKEVILTAMVRANSKFPTAHFDGLGYMPGEIYSFGIVYIFEDNTTSPVYHIPGKSPAVDPSMMYSLGENVYPMDNSNNQNEDNRYLSTGNCEDVDSWGRDSEGTPLLGELVRHHRFPLRTDYNIPFVEKIDTTVVSSLYKVLKITGTGEIEIPIECAPSGDPDYDPACVPNVASPFSVTIFYTEDGNATSFTVLVEPSDWDGDSSPIIISYDAFSETLTGTNIIVTGIEEEGVAVPGTWTLNTFTATGTSPKGLDYIINLTDDLSEITDEIYSAQLFGIRFSNIEMPSSADLNGNKVIGYYIVRNERTEEDKTILDSAVLTSTVKNEDFISAGLLMPQFEDDTKIKKDFLNMINPEFKFNGEKYTNFTKIIQQGRFNKVESIYSRTKINDVLDGTSYVSGKHKQGESDSDGWSIQIKTRDNITSYINQKNFEILSEDIKETFYLDALADKLVLDSEDNGADVFNLACDNKTGILSLKENITFPIMNSVPYVYIYKENINSYSNFRLTPYYKESRNPQYFNTVVEELNTTDVFNGDSYIAPIRYVNSIFYDNRIKRRAGKTSAWNYIAGAILVALAVVAAIFIPGAGLAVGAALVGLAGGLVGGAALLIASGIKQDAWNRAYNDLYKKGLRETIADDYVKYDADPNNGQQRGFSKNPVDDEIQWLGECLNLWFESNVNMNLRNGNTDNTPDFLNAPGLIELGDATPEFNREYFGINSVGTGKKDVEATTALDNHMLKKLTSLDYNRKSGRLYIGLALAEIYQINPDYQRRNKQKIYNHLALEYDCCSDCTETFPNRWHWSEQSFQEELTDNFRLFLPNNYKDLEGNTGRITDIFRIQNNLYLHTEESLWHLPQTFQERVTNNIVSFLGTGEYFSVPARKIVDDEDSSAGNINKWGKLKNKHGVFFPCHKEKKWYQFNGDKLRAITDAGMIAEFRENMNFAVEQEYYDLNSIPYPYLNNPSNPIGVGYISTYDSTKERFIITKKDFSVVPGQLEEGTELCGEGGDTIAFPDLEQTIADQAALGWNFIGIENCVLKFQRVTYDTVTQIRQIITTIPNDTEVYAFYDTSGSFDLGQLDDIKDSVIAWYSSFRPDDVGFTGLHHINDASERWLNYPSAIPSGGNVLVLTFVNEANPVYHGTGIEGTLSAPTTAYTDDYDNFINVIYPSFSNFVGINYPIMTNNVADNTGVAFLQHSLAAVKGRNYTLIEVNELEVNSAYTPVEWSTIKTSLLTNSYSGVVDGVGDPGLEKYNWIVKSNKNDLGTVATADCPASLDIISPCQFAQDINTILADFTTITEVEVEVSVPTTETLDVEGEVVVLDTYNTSYTMSYSLEDEAWISWHSYRPSFYFNLQEKFYAWINGNNFIWKFNRNHHYLTYFGVKYDFIVEYVDNSNPLMTQITDGIMFQTEAKKYDAVNKEEYDEDITFNKILAYNSYQITGVLDLIIKNNETANYLYLQTINSNNYITIDRNERNWTLNTLRNLKVANNVPMFIKSLSALSPEYIDKIVNPAAIDYNKDWTQLESLRDKFLVVRLIFDTFDDTKLIMNFAVQDKKVSER